TFCESRLCFGLHLLENRLADQPRERTDQTPVEAKLPQRLPTEAFDSCLGGKNCLLGRLCPKPEIPRCLCVSGTSEPAKITRCKVETAPAIGTPEFSCNADDNLVVWNFRQDNEAR